MKNKGKIELAQIGILLISIMAMCYCFKAQSVNRQNLIEVVGDVIV